MRDQGGACGERRLSLSSALRTVSVKIWSMRLQRDLMVLESELGFKIGESAIGCQGGFYLLSKKGSSVCVRTANATL